MSGISFKIAAPSRPSSASAPPSRPSSSAANSRPPHSSTRISHNDNSDDDDEDDEGAFGRVQGRDRKRPRLGKGDEEVVEFGRNGATSKHAKPPSGPLVIPALPNKDWRKAAEELRAGRNPRGGRKKEIYLPEASGGMRMAGGPSSASGSATPATDKDVDKINAEEVKGGLEQMTKTRPPAPDRPDTEEQVEQVRSGVASASVDSSAPAPAPAAPREAETDEQRALRELLGEEAARRNKELEQPEVEAIVSAADNRGGPVSEEAAFKRDVESRPDEASLEDYDRVPVGSFGLAMLRGMGWQPGQAASRTGRGAVEAHVPSSRPALLGIGAKPMAEAMGDDGKGKKGGAAKAQGGRSKREEMKFMPLMKRERERIEGPGGSSASGSGRNNPITNGSTSSSRRSSRSPPPSFSSRRRSRSRSPRREGGSSRRYDDEYSSSARRDRERERDYDSSSSRRDRDRDRDRGSSRRDDRDDRDRDRGSSRRERDRDEYRASASSSRRDEEDRDRRERRRDDDRDRRDRRY
ncbi:hypothetical protein JCM8097_007662 [Rhodosporidiobolus ruineniae]